MFEGVVFCLSRRVSCCLKRCKGVFRVTGCVSCERVCFV